MKATGMVRAIDKVGRIVIPIEIRKQYNIECGDSLEMFTDNDTIVLRKYQPACIFCGDAKDTKTFNDVKICRNCLERLKSL